MIPGSLEEMLAKRKAGEGYIKEWFTAVGNWGSTTLKTAENVYRANLRTSYRRPRKPGYFSNNNAPCWLRTAPEVLTGPHSCPDRLVD